MVKKKFTIGWFLRNIVLLIASFIVIFPLVHMIAVSLFGVTPVKNGEVFFWPKEFSTNVYKELFADPNKLWHTKTRSFTLLLAQQSRCLY